MKRWSCAFTKGPRWAAIILAFVAFTSAIPSAHAAESTWNLTRGGSWGDAANWSPATVPDGIDAVANLTHNITRDAMVSLDQAPAGNRTVGTLNIGDADGSHVFHVKLQGVSLSFRVSSGHANLTLTENAKAEVHTFIQTSGRILLHSDLHINNNKVGGGGLSFQGAIIESEPCTLTLNSVAGAGGFTFGGLNEFSKLAVNANVGFTTIRVTDDRALGKAHTNYTADAVTLNGGTLRVGANGTITINANRGITLGAGGGTIYAPSGGRHWAVDSIIAGSAGGGLTLRGTGTTTLNAANTYNGDTKIHSGTLALGASGSISNTPQISIAAGATFDVSAIPHYTLSGSTTLSAVGQGRMVGMSAAAIRGGTSVSLGSQPIRLTYDGYNPALLITRGTLVLAGNAFTVNRAPALAAGTYTIVSQASGSISSSGSHRVSGTAIGIGMTGSISVVDGDVILTIRENYATLRQMLIILGGLAVVLVLAFVWITVLHIQVRERTAQLEAEILERERAEKLRGIAEERSRIARDIHDDLGANLTRVALLGKMAADGAATPEEVRAQSRQVSEAANDMVQSLEAIVWAVRPENDTLRSLLEFMNRRADELFETTPRQYQFVLPPDPPECPVHAELRHNVVLAYKEALTNAVKHAQATAVRVEVSFDTEVWRIQISDNGKGFDPAAARTEGTGLRNMRRRMEEIGGTFELQSQSGHGTTVRLVFPLRQQPKA
jgi:autotransporter-associated beta strand protein